jgi:hypothetical protein
MMTYLVSRLALYNWHDETVKCESMSTPLVATTNGTITPSSLTKRQDL